MPLCTPVRHEGGLVRTALWVSHHTFCDCVVTGSVAAMSTCVAVQLKLVSDLVVVRGK